MHQLKYANKDVVPGLRNVQCGVPVYEFRKPIIKKSIFLTTLIDSFDLSLDIVTMFLGIVNMLQAGLK